MPEYYHYIETPPDQNDFPMLVGQLTIAFIEAVFIVVSVGEIIEMINK